MKRKARSKPSWIDIYVGARIREARKGQNMPQSTLARKINLTFQQVQKYEKGINRVSCGILAQISKVLNRPLDWFFPEQYRNSEKEKGEQQ